MPASEAAKEKRRKSETGDFLWGAAKIAKFLFGERGNRRSVYYLAKHKGLPVFRLASALGARRSVLLKWIEAQEEARLDEHYAREYSPRQMPGSRGQTNRNNTGEQTEGHLPDERKIVSPEDGLEGLRLFLRAFAEDGRLDEARLAEAALIAAKIRIAGRPIWDDRKRYENLKHFNAARFVRAVYADLIESGPNLPDGGSIWHLLLPGDYPVWQEAVRSYDSKVVQMLHVYINGRGTDLGDAEGLIFAKKVNRPTAKKPKTRPIRYPKRFQLE